MNFSGISQRRNSVLGREVAAPKATSTCQGKFSSNAQPSGHLPIPGPVARCLHISIQSDNRKPPTYIGADYAHLKPQACLRTLAGMAHALRVADRPAVRHGPDRGTVPALRGAGGGRRPRPRPPQRVRDDVLPARRATARNCVVACAAEKAPSRLREAMPAGRSRRNSSRRAVPPARRLYSCPRSRSATHELGTGRRRC